MKETYIKIWSFPSQEILRHDEMDNGAFNKRLPKASPSRERKPKGIPGGVLIPKETSLYLETTDRDVAKKLEKYPDKAHLISTGYKVPWRYRFSNSVYINMVEFLTGLTDRVFYHDELTEGITTQYYPPKRG